MASQPGQVYTENFADIANWTNAFASGIGANRWGSVAVNATGTIPDGVRITAATTSFVSGSSGGVQRGTQNIMLLSTGATNNTSSCAIDVFLDFSSVTAGTLSFDWASVNNSTGDRNGSMRVYTSTDGVAFTELAGAGVLNFTNNVLTSGSVTTVALPVAFTSSPTARIRFYYHNGTGGTTGSRPKISIDNLSVTGTLIGPSCGITLGTITPTCNTVTPGSSDTYDLSIAYSGVQTGLTVTNASGSGSGNVGDDPASVDPGTMVFQGISEADAYSITFSVPCSTLVASGPAPGCDPPPTIVINEILADPAVGVTGDANGDGASSATADEFVEVVNFGASPVDISGWTLSDGVGVRHTFPASTVIPASCGVVVFGGGTPTGFFGFMTVQVASTSTLGLNNAGDNVVLRDGASTIIDSHTYAAEGGNDHSLTRDPDLTGTFVDHTLATGSGGTFFSPGTLVSGTFFGGCPAPPCTVSFGTATATCTTVTPGPGDTYSVSIPYFGSQAGVTVNNNSGSGGGNTGNDPAVFANGTIVIAGIAEGTAYNISLSAPCTAVVASGVSPSCEPPPPPPTLVINEVDADQPSTDTGEFIEIKNTGVAAVDLNGLRLVLYNGATNLSYSTTLLANVLLAAGDYYVVCYGTNASAYCDQTGVGGSVQNGNPDGIRLSTADGSTIIDQMSYGALPMITTEGTSAPVEPLTANLGVARLPDGSDSNDNSVDFVVNCITPGASNVAADSDNDGTPDCQDVCNGGPEPGTPCEDNNANTGNDVIQANCLCQGVPIDCEGTPGGAELPGTDCDDQDANTVDDVWGLDCVCAGVPLDCLGVPAGPAQPGTPCPGDNNAETVFDTFDANCGCVGIPCTTYFTVEFQNDANPGEVTWEIRQQGTNTLVQSGTDDIEPGQIGSATTCVSDGCYYLRVIDAGGDGMTVGGNGGYIFRTVGNPGTRIIDNRNNFGNLAGGPPDVSAIAANGGFCVPFGTTTTAIYTSCDKLDWVTGEYLVCGAVPAVSALWNAGNTPAEAISGYEFQIFNPNGGYIYNRFRSHNVSDGFGPDNASRACHMKINNWAVANQVPANVLMNVRMRTRINGTIGNWGAACRFKIDPVRAACPLTKLMDIPGNANLSCNGTRVWGAGNYVHAVPVTGATQYQWRFRIDGESFITIRTTTTYFIQLNWVTLPLQNSKTYQVEVRAFKGGAWCIDTPTPAFCGFAAPCFTPWGDVCSLTIDNTPANGGNQNMTTSNGAMRMYPNPNRGDQLNVRLDAVEAGVSTVSVDIYELTGKRVSARTIAVNDGFVNTVLELNDMANGLYMVNITAGAATYTERLVIQK